MPADGRAATDRRCPKCGYSCQPPACTKCGTLIEDAACDQDKGLLSEDHSEIKLVPAAERDVWFKQASEIPLSKKREAAMEAVRRWRERKRNV